jgi:peptide/nickel transport system substrate-binding protein
MYREARLSGIICAQTVTLPKITRSPRKGKPVTTQDQRQQENQMKKSTALGFTLALMASPVLADGGRLVIADPFEITANWAMYSVDAYTGVRVGCYEGLTSIGYDLRVEPLLATSWAQTDPNTWVFKLRDGVTFQDGSALTGDAVAGALTHLLNAPVPARAFSKKVATRVEATGPLEVTITTPSPQVSMPGRLGAPDAAILSPAAYVGADEINPMGRCTGPFEIVEVDAKQFVKADRYDSYWGGAAKLDGVDILFVPDGNTRATMARSGEAHISKNIPATSAVQITAQDGVSSVQVNAPRVAEILLNNSKPPFDNADARRAVRAALDVAGVTAAVYEDLATPANDPFRDGEPWGGASTPTIIADLSEAAALFKKAGIDPKGLELEMLVYNSKPALGVIAEILQASLSELGVKVNIRTATYGALEPDLLGGNYNIAMMSRGYLTDVPEPIGFFSADYTCDGGFNVSQHCNPAFDAKVTTAAAEADSDARYAIYAELAQYLYDEAVTIFVVNETVVEGVSDKVQGYTPHPLNSRLVTTGISISE